MAKPTILTFWPTYVVDITGIFEIVRMKGGNCECYDWMAKWLQNSTSRVARARGWETSSKFGEEDTNWVGKG